MIPLNDIVEPKVTISFVLNLINYIVNVNGHDHAQFIQSITCHFTCVLKMKKDTVDVKVVVNNAFNFENLFDDNGKGQSLEAEAAFVNNMEDGYDYANGIYNSYNYVD